MMNVGNQTENRLNECNNEPDLYCQQRELTMQQKRELATEVLTTLNAYSQSNDTTPQAVRFITQHIGMIVEYNRSSKLNRGQVLEYLYKLFYHLDELTTEQLKGYPKGTLPAIALLHNTILYAVIIDYITDNEEEITERAKASGNTNIVSITQAMLSSTLTRQSLEFNFITTTKQLDRVRNMQLDSLPSELDEFIDEIFFQGLQTKLNYIMSEYYDGNFSISATISGKDCYLYPSSYYADAVLVEYEHTAPKKQSITELKMHLLQGTMQIEDC